MNEFDISELSKRYNSLVNEVTYTQRKRKEEAEKAVEALHRISDEDIELLKKYVPAIEDVTKFTVEQLLENTHGECEQVNALYSKLANLLDGWLKHYEDAL